MKKFTIGAVCAATISLAAGAQAATIYDEGVSGDLTPSGSPIPMTVDLVLGSNEILGTLQGTPPTDVDNINFKQTAGLNVDSIVLTFGSAFGNGENGTTSIFVPATNLFDDAYGSLGFGDSSVTASFVDSTGPGIGPLEQDIDDQIWAFNLNGSVLFSAKSWTLTIVTSAKPIVVDPDPVPLPASLPLLLAGFGGLAFLRRRKQS